MAQAVRRSEEWLAQQLRRQEAHAKTLPMNFLTLVLPFPPTVNHSGKDGRRYGKKTDRYKAFMCSVHGIVLNHGSPRLEGRLAMDIVVVCPDKRRRDIDNLAKGLIDALGHAGVFGNDEQIDDLRIRREHNMPDDKIGGATVTIRRIA